MGTHSLKSAMQRGIGLPVRVVSGGVLILTALLLLLPSVAFAFTSTVAGADPAQNLAQAGVSVVRLVVTYTPSSNLPVTGPTFACTGLGVLVASGSTTGTAKDTWLLTDGNLVNTTKMTCPPSPVGSAGVSLPGNMKLTQIQVLVSSGSGGYTATSPTPLKLATIPIKAADVICENAKACEQGPALVGFSTGQPQPFIDLSSASATTQSGIDLVNPASNAPVTANSATQYLTPSFATASTSEPGMPIVDAQGNLTGLHLMNGSPASLSTITSFLHQHIAQPSNILHDNWDKGIQAYYQSHDYATAQSDFQLAANANPNFQAGTFFKNLASAHLSNNGGGVGSANPTNTGSSTAGKATNGFLGFPLWQISVGALVVVLLLVILISLLIGRVRRQDELEKFKEDAKAAERRAAMEAPRIADVEQRQAQGQGNRNGRLHPPVSGEAASAPPAPVMNAVNMQAPQGPQQMSPVMDMRCPQCGNPVSAQTQVCSHCNTWLSPTDSALHLRAVQPPPGTDMGGTRPLPPMAPQYQQPVPPQQPPVPPQQSPSPAAPPPMAAPASAYAQPAPNFAAADKPTVLFGFSNNGQDGEEKTAPYDIRKVGSVNLGLVVGARTDRGIKRKHKPNEDSLFAAQGAGMFDSSPQEFGLFVVADGMGGHANGQDASRLAIQTIIDFVLPRLSASNGLNRNALAQLLVEGVQRANQAVFQSNMEHHADMGTTMTTALVVGATAFVANVGDSRTYLYREPEGLRKVTNDHSVVASLVEAGIIKPDDIYTHPKRNQIYRSLGEKPSVEVDSFTVDLIPGDKLLLCTDGLWDMVRDPAIQEVLRSATANPDQTGEALIHAALKGGGEDNVSVIVVYVTESAEQTPVTGIRLLAKPETIQMPPIFSFPNCRLFSPVL